MAEKYLCKRSIFRNVRGCSSFSNLFMHFKQISSSSRKILQAYSKICIFCVIQCIDFQKQSVRSARKVFGKSLKTLLDEVYFLVILKVSPYPLALQANLSFPQVSHLSPSQAEKLQKLSPPPDMPTIALMCIISMILSHEQTNQKNQIFKRRKKIQLLEAIHFFPFFFFFVTKRHYKKQFFSEADIRRFSTKQAFLKIWQKLQKPRVPEFLF